MDRTEIILRLRAATLVGGTIGLNRKRRGKPAGVGTQGIVGLASALVVTPAGRRPGERSSLRFPRRS